MGYIAIAARNRDVNPVTLIERDTTTGDVNVHSATQYVYTSRVFIV